MKNITRTDYINGTVTHSEYYGAIAHDAGIDYSDNFIKVCLASTDEHMNDIDLSTWDGIAMGQRNSVKKALEERGDTWSLAGGVCAAKQAMRDIIENNKR